MIGQQLGSGSIVKMFSLTNLGGDRTVKLVLNRLSEIKGTF